jgi:biopolymer transport protein ExbD
MKPNVVAVRVFEKDGQCAVSDYQIACESAASYLKDQLRLASDTLISVNPEAIGDPEQHVRDVAAQLRHAGFENVAIVGFVTSPKPNNALQRTLEDSHR